MTELFNFLAERGVTPNGLCQIHSMHTQIGFKNYTVNELLYDALCDKGMLTPIYDDYGPITYEITETGLLLLNDAQKFFAVKSSVKNKTLHEEWVPMIERYRGLFPKGSGSGQAYRTNYRDLYQRFVWFFDTYKYSWEIIFVATKAYIQTYTNPYGQTPYLKTAGYLIRKQDSDKANVSILADYCEQVLEGEQQEQGMIGYFPTKEL